MTLEIIIVFTVLAVSVILFITEKLPVDLVAICAEAVLLLTRVLTVEEGLKGFNDEATITIASMFILSGGLFRTGVVNYLGRIVIKLYTRNFGVAIIATMLIIGIIPPVQLFLSLCFFHFNFYI